jgi:hypothetical protein
LLNDSKGVCTYKGVSTGVDFAVKVEIPGRGDPLTELVKNLGKVRS